MFLLVVHSNCVSFAKYTQTVVENRKWQCSCLVSPRGKATEHGDQFLAEVAVHERVDDRVSYVVDEVDVEDESVV